jgi:FtsP/CotA-like multicopper oxidase with cupredoxin domain
MAGVGLAVAVLLPIMGLTREREREIRLVAVDRAFHLEGDRQPNPTLRLRAGERVTVVLRNEDDGMRHDFTIKAWGVAVPAIDGRGERTVTFRVPGTRGSASYGCTPHPVSMRGAIVVE